MKIAIEVNWCVHLACEYKFRAIVNDMFFPLLFLHKKSLIVKAINA